jgi:hypothetical protein
MTQGRSKVFLVAGNENLRNKDVFLESLMYHQKLKKENPLLVNVIPNHNCFSGKPEKPDRKSTLPDFFDYYTDLDIPCISRERLIEELKGNNRKEFIALGDSFSNVFLLGILPRQGSQFYSYLDRCIDHIIFIIKNDYESSSYLFDFINGLYDKMIEKDMSIVISGIKRVEDAARLFVRIRDEMKEMIDSSLTFEFLGHLDLVINRITFAKKRGSVYVKMFENDSFHGNIKYISEKLAGLEYSTRTQPFFETVADLVQE